MSNNAIETKDIVEVNSVSRAALVVVSTNSSANGRTRNISIQNLLANSDHDIKAANLHVTFHTTPANSTANCVQGQYWNDNTYFYIAVANNVIKRIELEDF